MAHDVEMSELAANAAADVVGALMSGGTLYLFANRGDAGALAKLTFADPAFYRAENGAIKAKPMGAETDAPSSGIASWFQCRHRDGTSVILEGTVGTKTDDGGEDPALIVSNAEIKQGGKISLKTFTWKQPRTVDGMDD